MKKCLSTVLSVLLAFALLFPGITAYSQTEINPSVKDEWRTNIIAGRIYAEPGETVMFPVYILNNTGYASTGLRLVYAEGLTPNLKNDKFITGKGPAGDDVTITFSHNAENRIIGLGTMGADGEQDSGLMFTVEINVPVKAEGTYPMTLEVERWLDSDVNPVQYVTVDGFIKVGEDNSISASANPQNGGTVSGGGTYNCGGSATVTATPNDHYHFVSWTENGTVVSTSAEYTFTVENGRNLTANFAKDTFTITFINDDGTPLQSGSVAYGETPVYSGGTPAKDSTPEHTYDFAGWSPEITEVTGEATYTAFYNSTPVDYKLTWLVDSENYKNETIPFGSEITAPEVAAKDGYTFAWIDEIPGTMPAKDVTINGAYTAITYTATFVDENGAVIGTDTFIVEDTELDEPAVPEKPGYSAAWEEYTIGAGNITVKPVYTPEDICPLDNEYHGDSFMGRLVKFFHTVIFKAFALAGLNIFFKIS